MGPRAISFSLFAMGALSGCVSTSDPHAVTVKAVRHADSAATPKFALVYATALAESLVKPMEGQVKGALAQRGYEAVPVDEATVIIMVQAERERLSTTSREMTRAEAGLPRTSEAVGFESPRHRNLAGMVGGGRYSHLLNDHPDARGEIFIGPSNEIVATGDLAHMKESAPLPSIGIVKKNSGLLLNAVVAPVPSDPAAVTLLWQVEVLSEQELDQPTPDMDVLVRVALDHLEGNTHGRVKRVSTRAASP